MSRRCATIINLDYGTLMCTSSGTS